MEYGKGRPNEAYINNQIKIAFEMENKMFQKVDLISY